MKISTILGLAAVAGGAYYVWRSRKAAASRPATAAESLAQVLAGAASDVRDGADRVGAYLGLASESDAEVS